MIPLVWLAGSAVALVGSAAGWKLWSDANEYDAWKKTIPSPMPNGPQTPAAPSTREEMTNWTPEAAAERQVEEFYKWRAGLFTNYPEDKPAAGMNPWLVAAAVGATVFVLARK
jgi:hypothetical protein